MHQIVNGVNVSLRRVIKRLANLPFWAPLVSCNNPTLRAQVLSYINVLWQCVTHSKDGQHGKESTAVCLLKGCSVWAGEHFSHHVD